MVGALVCLQPENVGLDACGHTAATECLCDDISADLTVVVTLLHDVHHVVLDGVHPEGDDAVGVVQVADTVVGYGP